MYLAVVRVKSKWYSVAGWSGDPDSCLAVAEYAFKMRGIAFQDVTWQDRMERQKNYGGKRAEYVEIEATRTEADEYTDNLHAWTRRYIHGEVDTPRMPAGWQRSETP